MFQYSFCSYSTMKKWWRSTILTVSIQLLFLFNHDYEKSFQNLSKFQYSFCSYSTVSEATFYRKFLMFQYSFCSYSTGRSILWTVNHIHVSIQLLFLFNKHGWNDTFRKKKFQYSFCSYSTQKKGQRTSCRIVSIQLLFLFNTKKAGEEIGRWVSIQLLFLFNRYLVLSATAVICFNTASVLIQPICDVFPNLYDLVFQYSFCSYSTD